jgi:hypothetical protein
MGNYDARADIHNNAKGYSKITGLDTARGLHEGTLGAIPNGVNYVEIQCESRDVRYRDDGTAPTTSDGMKLPAGMGMSYREDLDSIRFIEVAPSATLHVSFYA